ncbi:MAG: NADP oxidoreductase [Calditerrivibrio sp.]|nr:NADP oxidoreductase [Calditerrivibrio sp.]
MNKKKLATIWLDGCSGCHMSFLDIDERIVEILTYFDIVYSPLVDQKEYPDFVDVALIEGAVSTHEDIQKLKKIRSKTAALISIGDCAITGNVPSMRNPFNLKEVIHRGYLENSDGIVDPVFTDVPPLLSKVLPVHEVVHVNYFLPGCPPPAEAFYNLIKSLLENNEIDIFNFTRFGK